MTGIRLTERRGAGASVRITAIDKGSSGILGHASDGGGYSTVGDEKGLRSSKLTIIVPVYNSDEYLPDLLASFASQTSHAFDVVFVDDGSTDSSRLIVEEWQRLGVVPCCILHKENGGQSSARNAGIEVVRARGNRVPWTMFVDSDDMLASTAVEELVSAAERFDADDLLYTAEAVYQNVDLEREHPAFKTLYKRSCLQEGIVRDGREVLAQAVAHGEFVAQPCLQVLKTSYMLDARLAFEEGIIHEDNLFSAQCLLSASKVAFLDRSLYIRRVRNGSTMTDPIAWKNVDGYFRCAVSLLDSISQYGDVAGEPVSVLVNDWIDQAAAVYARLSEEERRGAERYPARERALFLATVLNRFAALQNREALDKRVAHLERSITTLERELLGIRGSESYRIGCALTALPRWVKAKLSRSTS